MTLRHCGILVKCLERATVDYKRLGFLPVGPVEHLRVQKMRDVNGGVIELVQGNWQPHIAVNWYEDDDKNLIETVREVR